VSRIVGVKVTYRLWVTDTEHDAIARVLTSCNASDTAPPPGLDESTTATVPPAEEVPPPTPEYTPPPTSDYARAPLQPSLESPSAVYYPNCKAAKAAGAAPLHIGDPGYRSGLDGDCDGVACER
jgi:hypothetical protein